MSAGGVVIGHGTPGVCQRWTDRRHSWRHVHQGGFDRARFDWSVIAEVVARGFVGRHHYSGTFPSAKLSFGMWRGGELVGVAVLGFPVRAEVLTNPFPGLVPYRESVELSRFVLVDDVAANGETWFLGRIWAYLRAETEIRGVLAFSDPHARVVEGRTVKPGHWGTIYQAGSARYLGLARARWLTLLPDGTVFNDRSRAKLLAGDQGWRYVRDGLIRRGAPCPAVAGVPDREWLSVALSAVGGRRERHGGNHRYAFPLHRAVALGMPELAYPKAEAVAA